MCIMSKTSNIIAKIKELFAEEKMAKDYRAATGEIIRCLGDSLAVGERVIEIAAEKESPLADGNYLLDNGKTITVEAGTIKEINEYNAEKTKPEEVVMEKQEEMGYMKDKMKDKMEDYKNIIESKLKDGTEAKILSKGDALSVGDEVMVKDAEGNFIKAPEGKHELEGGLVIYVDGNGFINELETKETEKETEDNEEMKTMFEAVSSMKSIVDELKSTINDLKKENTELKEKFNKFAAEPSVESITKKNPTVERLAKKDDKLKFFGTK